jgi:hypothetical protein
VSRRWGLLVALLSVIAVAGATRAAPASAASPSIRHVFVIVLENESASTTFGAGSPAPYLSKTLPAQGAYLPRYDGIGHNSNDNYIAMISGQAPNVQNQADCQEFDDMLPGTIGSFGQAQGTGCVYPASVPTIASQLTTAGFTWRDYDESMGADAAREPAVCGHPALNGSDNTQTATAADMYATRHNPFVYFHSIIDDTTLCDTHVVNLDELPQDLGSSAATANYSFIVPDLCDDGHDSPCANGQPGGLAQADSFLKTWVPRITSSAAFKQDGLLIVTFDEAATSDTSSCCGEIAGPGSPEPGENGPGGGDVGAVLLSPCIAPGTVSQTPYNHYTMLGSVENVFGLSHLGYAQLPGGTYFGSDIYNRSCGATSGGGGGTGGGGGPAGGSSPAVKIHSPKIASQASTRPRVSVRWSVATGSGPALGSYTVQARNLSAGHGAYATLLNATRKTKLSFRGSPGDTYAFRVHATNVDGHTGSWATTTTIIPSGVHIAKGHFSRHWRTVARRGAWQQHAIQTSTGGAHFTLRYVGGALSLIGETTARGGVLTVILDGRSRTLRLHSDRLHRRRIIYRAEVKPGVHRLRLVDRHGLVALEGLAIASRTG